MEQLFFAGKAYLKINSLVKTPLHEFMAVERSGLWAPGEPNCTIHWIKIYLEDSAIQPLNNRGPKTGVEIACSPVPGSVPPLGFKSFTTPLQVPRHLSLAASPSQQTWPRVQSTGSGIYYER